MKYRALWHINSSKTEVREADLEKQEGQDCLVEAYYSMISTGTERLVATGRVPTSLYDRMQVPFMQGSFEFPIQYGYSLVGKVISDDHPLKGKAVHLLHPHQSHNWVPEQSLSLIPEKIPLKRAALASNMETALTAVWDGGVSVGDKVLISGFGMIGALIAMILRKMPAVELWIDEPKPERRDLAKSLGLRLWEEQQDLDVAFHTSSTPAGLQACIDRLADSGKVVELSWYGEKEVSIRLGESFHTGRKQIIASQVSNLPADRLYRWDYARRKQVVFDLLHDPDFDKLITGEVSLKDAPSLFKQIREGKEEGMGWVISYNDVV